MLVSKPCIRIFSNERSSLAFCASFVDQQELCTGRHRGHDVVVSRATVDALRQINDTLGVWNVLVRPLQVVEDSNIKLAMRNEILDLIENGRDLLWLLSLPNLGVLVQICLPSLWCLLRGWSVSTPRGWSASSSLAPAH